MTNLIGDNMNTNRDLLNLVVERLENMLVTIRETREDVITPLSSQIREALLLTKQNLTEPSQREKANMNTNQDTAKTILIPDLLYPICGEDWVKTPDSFSEQENVKNPMLRMLAKGTYPGLVVLLSKPKIEELEKKMRETGSYDEARNVIVNYVAEELGHAIRIGYDYGLEDSPSLENHKRILGKANEALRDSWESSGLDFKTWASQFRS